MSKSWSDYMNREGWIEYISQGEITGAEAGRLVEAKFTLLEAENARLREALEVAQLWLANCMPIGDIPGPKPLPLIAAALAAAPAAKALPSPVAAQSEEGKL
jgi:hypothetical protein